MGRELDAQIAEKLFGFRREKTPPDINGEFGGDEILVPPDIDHKTWNYPPSGKIGFSFHVTRMYSSDLNAAHEVEEKIKEMGLIDEYIYALWKDITPDCAIVDMFETEDLFKYTHATAEQRCKAALAAVQNKMKRDAFLAETIERAEKHKYQEPNSEVGCDKTFECCRKLGNEKRFGGFADLSGLRGSRCQFKFGSKECGYDAEGKR